MIFRTAKIALFAAAMPGLAALLPVSSSAAPYLVKDINPGPAGSAFSQKFVSYPSPAALGSTVFFQADDGTSGSELWKSDGTMGGTVMVKDIWPETPPATGTFSSKPEQFTAAGGYMFFAASGRVDPVTLLDDFELWRSDGTAIGTTSLDIYAGPVSSSPSNLTAMGPNVYLSAWSAAVGNELFRAGGGGASLVKDIITGTDVSAPRSFAVGNIGVDRLFFTAYDDNYDRELWMSDGTEGGTARLKDINPIGSSDPSGFTSFGGKVYFKADDGTNGSELWGTDGTEGGTTLVKDINPSGSSGPFAITPAGSVFFFTAYNGLDVELWKSDGTELNTTKVSDVVPLSPYTTGLDSMVFYGGRLYFAAYDAVSGCELWTSDPTTDATGVFLDLNPGNPGGMDGSFCPSDLTVVDGILYFSARHETAGSGRELWATNGTDTVIAAEAPGWEFNGPEGLTPAGSLLFFLFKGLDTGRELWAMPTGDVVTQPDRPSGPGGGVEAAPLGFTSGGSVSLKGRALQYRFDWGDGSDSGWLDPDGGNSVNGSHAWAAPATYTITVEAHETTGGITSVASATSTVTISTSEAVSLPTISGPAGGTAGVTLGFEISDASSTHDHALEYSVDWGDGSPVVFQDYADPVSLTHAWASAGDYTLGVVVRCKTHTTLFSSNSVIVATSDPPPAETITGINFAGTWDGEIYTPYNYTVSAISSDNDVVEYTVDWGDGSSSTWAAIDLGADSDTLSHSWTEPGNYQLNVTVRCQTHTAISGSGSWWVNIVNPVSEVIDPPPTDPTTGTVEIWRGYSAVFSSSGAVSNWGSEVEYQFDWGDGTPDSAWLAPGPGNTVSASHSWDTTGTPYLVWVTARSKNDPANVHATSGPLYVSIIDPEVVNAPGIPGGRTFGAVGTSYSYTSDLALSWFGHTVEYQFDWGDGTFSTWSTSQTASHSWSAAGNPWEVRSRGRCATHREVVSDWSVPLEVIMLGGAGGELFVCKSGCAYSNVQDAVTAAADGNAINVGDGTYSGDVDFGGKGITIRSLNGPDAVTLLGSGAGPVVTVSPAAPSRTAVLEGFTVTGGSSSKGGGIYANGSQAEVRRCVVVGNSAVDGGGIYATASELLVVNSIVSGNSADIDGGGIFLAGSNADIVNSTVAGNRADEYGGGLVNYSGSPAVVNSVFWGNRAGMEGDQIDVDSGSVTVSWTNVETADPASPWPGSGNIAADPLFAFEVPAASAPTAAGDYHLKSGSPCLDAGRSSGEPLLPATDVDGEKRPQHRVYDMGADEGSAPAPVILANGRAGSLTVPRTEEVVVTISLDPGSYGGIGADYWVLARTPFRPPSDWYHFVPPRLWLPGDTVTYRGAVMKLSSYRAMARRLPPGKYIFYFGVDLNGNGLLDVGDLFHDSVAVTVTP